ncbi:type ISP restriction/modification enzyme [Limnoraphis robusta]|uniref:site-specific DNA-methyltransferase (adenine-specific) n=1 Tax=Limnoraphis robusta CCNP1315 TaxID=3110306 RepID=A0ABU5TTG6_9CYAN|nr:type ISP restriction/modification enzyme [Limnoraphis robusta]MEA5518197.1 type ISP restriction/modification enzyme [Limnoraphis robusta CCNP1315]MEA5543359.1 type ISP restriction/modification enzyme [Limnoraphis robusta CCNP1324]
MTPFETYIRDLQEIRATGAAVKETSYYGALEKLLNELGKTLKPKVRCVMQLKNIAGAGMPDGGLFTASQFQRKSPDAPTNPTNPERGVIEIKGTGDDAWVVAQTKQVSKYWDKYRQVLVTNYRDFVLIGQDANGQPITLETYRLAKNEKEFWEKAKRPKQFTQEQEEQFTEYLKRVMLQSASIATPKDLAWFLASYAKDAKARIEKTDIPALETLRQALEEALGITFQGDKKDPKKGERFFKSTLIQTLFYGIFSAWVLWHKQQERGRFDWRVAGYYLHVPMIKALFEKVATPTHVRRLDLEEVLNWTGDALNRVDGTSFFSKFNEGEAVQYFYEPFLEAFDPELRKELGVWYTPPEIVQYMVARVDTVLREELQIEDGLADPNVYILDPCCGTGAYLVEVLRRIDANLQDKGMDALVGSQLKEAAMNRVFGFEILTAPFVVAHLQLGLLLQNLGVPLSDEQERVGVYLTNALTGWEPPTEDAKAKYKQLSISYPELEQEREAADEVKQNKPILVVLGNPPYNAFAGVSSEEEQGLVEPYKVGLISEWGIKKFNLDELYVRFFGLAERCIVQQNPIKGIVCFISSFSYLSDPSFVVMRQHFLNEFDNLWFDCMNGSSRETGKLTPEGDPDPSAFSTEYNREGIRQGTAISLMVRRDNHSQTPTARFRHFWGTNKRADLLDSLRNQDFNEHYQISQPNRSNRLSFRNIDTSEAYLSWPTIVDLSNRPPFRAFIEARRGVLIDIEKSELERRMRVYFDSNTTWEDLKKQQPALTEDAARFDAKKARTKVLAAEIYSQSCIRRYTVRPLENRWCYHSRVRPLWNEPRPELWAQCWEGNRFLVTRLKTEKEAKGSPIYFSSSLVDYQAIARNVSVFPLQLRSMQEDHSDAAVVKQIEISGISDTIENTTTANLSSAARRYLLSLGISELDNDPETAELVWMHVLAIGYSPNYLEENADGIRENFPRIPLPDNRETLIASANLGRQIAALLDPETPVAGVTSSKLRPELKAIAVVSRVGTGNLDPNTDFALTAGWGHKGKNNITMPGKGKAIARPYTPEEQTAIAQVIDQLGTATHDIYLNDIAYWKNIPDRVWNYTIGGYQVIKKWLSYREQKLLGRSLKLEEVTEVTYMARRIAAILLLEPELDANYEAVKQATYSWSRPSE